jgi:hypothetical protein
MKATRKRWPTPRRDARQGLSPQQWRLLAVAYGNHLRHGERPRDGHTPAGRPRALAALTTRLRRQGAAPDYAHPDLAYPEALRALGEDSAAHGATSRAIGGLLVADLLRTDGRCYALSPAGLALCEHAVASGRPDFSPVKEDLP